MPSRSQTGSVKPAVGVADKPPATPKTRPVKRPFKHPGFKETTLDVEDCPHCGQWVLAGWADGCQVRLDIWRVPVADALVIARYRDGRLFRLVGPKRDRAALWSPAWNKDSTDPIAIHHECDAMPWWSSPAKLYQLTQPEGDSDVQPVS